MRDEGVAQSDGNAHRGLRVRAIQRLVLAALVFLVLGTVSLAFASPLGDGSWLWVLLGTAGMAAVSVTVLSLHLLTAPCPSCGARFSPVLLRNTLVFPPPAVFVASCSACGASARLRG